LYARDYEVLSRCVAAGIPVAAVIGGGYDHNMDALAERHSLLHRAATAAYRRC
jgi:hypothetical protein